MDWMHWIISVSVVHLLVMVLLCAAHHPVGPFYTIGRFARAQCTGKNRLEGICLTRGECDLGEGVQAGPCGHSHTNSFSAKHAICCTCKYIASV